MNNRGRRYDEPKLNIKKVLAVIVAVIVIIMFIIFLKGLFTKSEPNTKITSQSYFSIFKDGKWGVIDSNGNAVIDPFYEEMVIIPNQKTDIFLCTYDVNYEQGTYKTKALNSKNEEILTQYESIEALANKDNSHLWYEENVLKVAQNGKYGTIDYTGKQLLPMEYEEITPLLGIENALLIRKDSKYGIAGNDGKIVIEPQYAEIKALGKNSIAGYIVKDDSGKYGIVGYSANTVLPCQYDDITQINGNDLYVVVQDTHQILVDKQGTEVLKTGFDEITQILKSQDNGIIYKQGDKYGIMTTGGEVKIQAKYDELQEAKSGIFIYKENDKYGIIDIQDEKKVEATYTSITYQEAADIYIAEKENYEADILDNTFTTKLSGMLLECNTEEGYIKLLQDGNNKYYTLQFEERQENQIFPNRTLFVSKQDEKYGFVDKDGKVVVDYQYDDVTEQNDCGFAGVKKDGKWGSIDRTGKIVQEPKYDLENYLLVNFIGKWHLGEDINMNYYNQD